MIMTKVDRKDTLVTCTLMLVKQSGPRQRSGKIKIAGPCMSS